MTDEKIAIQRADEIADEKIAYQYADKIAEEYRDVKSDCGGYANIKDAVLYGLRVNKARLRYRLEKENRKLKLLVKALLYEINQIWDIDEMDQDVVEAAEQIEKEADK